MIFVWLGILILLVLVELLTKTFTAICFALSAFLSMILTFVTDVFVIQFIVFVVFGTILFVIVKPILQQRMNSKYLVDNKNKIIGMIGMVVEEIDKNKNGEVKLENKRFVACANEKIKLNTVVKVIEIDGTKLRVCKNNEDKNAKR